MVTFKNESVKSLNSLCNHLLFFITCFVRFKCCKRKKNGKKKVLIEEEKSK